MVIVQSAVDTTRLKAVATAIQGVVYQSGGVGDPKPWLVSRRAT